MPKNTNSMAWLPRKDNPLSVDMVRIKGNAAQWTAHSMDAKNPKKSLLREKKPVVFIEFSICNTIANTNICNNVAKSKY